MGSSGARQPGRLKSRQSTTRDEYDTNQTTPK